MESAKQKALEAAGWTVGDAADFLGMGDAIEDQQVRPRGQAAAPGDEGASAERE